MPNFWIPSTKTSSPILNGWTEKPDPAVVPIPGVDNVQVNSVNDDDCTFVIAIPLVLSVANISTFSSGSPDGATLMSTEEIADDVKLAFNNPESITFLVTGLTIVNFGATA